MAAIVKRPPSTVQSWKSEGRIPSKEQPHVLDSARAAGFEITTNDVVFPLGVPPSEVIEQ